MSPPSRLTPVLPWSPPLEPPFVPPRSPLPLSSAEPSPPVELTLSEFPQAAPSGSIESSKRATPGFDRLELHISIALPLAGRLSRPADCSRALLAMHCRQSAC